MPKRQAFGSTWWGRRLDADPDRYAWIEPLGSHVEYEDMMPFAELGPNEVLRGIMTIALDGRGAFRRFTNLLADFPDVRRDWLAYRDGRMRQRILEWLAEQELAPAEGV